MKAGDKLSDTILRNTRRVLGVDWADGPDRTVLQYPRIPKTNPEGRKMIADALREWRRKRGACR